jgi:hypothetical protein
MESQGCCISYPNCGCSALCSAPHSHTLQVPSQLNKLPGLPTSQPSPIINEPLSQCPPSYPYCYPSPQPFSPIDSSFLVSPSIQLTAISPQLTHRNSLSLDTSLRSHSSTPAPAPSTSYNISGPIHNLYLATVIHGTTKKWKASSCLPNLAPSRSPK